MKAFFIWYRLFFVDCKNQGGWKSVEKNDNLKIAILESFSSQHFMKKEAEKPKNVRL